MTETITTQRLAEQAARFFRQRTRDNGSSFVTLQDESPQWLRDLVYSVHDDGGLLPDDYRYAWCRDAIEWIAGGEIGDQFADQVDDYTVDLLAWLASHGSRQGYCDQAQEEHYVEPDASTVDRVRAGQYLERRDVFELVERALVEHAAAAEEVERS